jgi:serine-type D-Ala-D-Ala carboxypeptidase (penicillin-binding protein 5/6)
MRGGKTIGSLFVVCMAILLSGVSVQGFAAPDSPNEVSEYGWVSGSAVPERQESTLSAATPQFTASSVIVIDAATAAPLFTDNADIPLPPASTTKLMTALVTRRHYDLDQVITVGEEAFTQGTTMGLTIGEQITVRELLAGLLISSGNDAAFALANNHPKGYQGFITDMNAAATELGMTLTHFNNPSGLDESNHMTTARDLATLTREVMRDPVLKDLAGTKQVVVTDSTGQVQHALTHTHQLLGVEPGVIAGKTGTTPLAGEVLISYWQPSQEQPSLRPVVLVIMGSQDRYQDTLSLLHWSQDNYHWRKWSEISTLTKAYGQ